MSEHSHSFLLIDPQPVVRQGLAVTLKEAFLHADVAACSTFADARRFLGLRPVGLVISEFRIDGETIIDLLETPTTNGTGSRCLVFSAFDESRFGATAIRGGASGFVSKSAPLADLTAAAQSILAGRPWISGRLARALASPDTADSPFRHLTRRERQIFTRLGNGHAVSRIATELGLSVKTIEAHREHIKTKLGLQTATQVTIAASRWIDDPAAQI